MSPADDRSALLQDILLPSFIGIEPEGVFVHLQKLRHGSEFETFITRLFGAGIILRGLEYAAFQKLLYDDDWLKSMQAKNFELRLAADVGRFEPARQALYHGVKLVDGGKAAEYLFEPVSLEITEEEQVYGEPDENGKVPVETRSRTRLVPAQLDFDEFVADMWLKGVRFGIDAETVRRCISSGAMERVKIAYQLEPTEGKDAEIREVSPRLHRDDTPRILANGKADLRAFKNHFPQMAKGERMIQKIPRQLGKPGRRLDGTIIEPKLPKDIDLAQMAAVGTRIESGKDGDFIVAAMSGFLVLDPHTNQISVTEKIENRGGISIRTTGDLALSVDEFIEHGEVQEGRLVEGKHMTFLSDVYGKVVSHEGNIRLKSNLAGGKAEAMLGDIEVGGKVSRAELRARQGELRLPFAESSVLVAKRVHIGHAVNCDIVAEEIHAEKIEGCTLAGRKIEVGSSDERRGRDTQIWMVIPDAAPFEQFLAGLDQRRQQIQQKLAAVQQRIAAIRENPDFAKVYALEQRIKSGEIKLTGEQIQSWRKLLDKHAPAVNQLTRLESERSSLEGELAAIAEEQRFTEEQRAAQSAGIACNIAEVKGRTAGQTLPCTNGIDALAHLGAQELRTRLQKQEAGQARVFVGDSGSIAWQFKTPKAN